MNDGQKIIALAAALGFAALLSLVSTAEVEGARQRQVQVQELKVTLWEGRDCLQDSGVVEDVVLTNDDADERLQHCAGGVTWKEMRR